ncbi:MAG: hypothetical protein ACLQU2_23080 [Candidatus Binataceae bacterium]
MRHRSKLSFECFTFAYAWIQQKEDFARGEKVVQALRAVLKGDYQLLTPPPGFSIERTRKRSELLAASERALNQIVAATQPTRNPLRGKARIALRVGGVLGRYKMRKHFRLTIAEDSFSFVRDDPSIAREAALDGIYVIRTSVPAAGLSSDEAVLAYKRLAQVELTFRSFKSVEAHSPSP